MKINKIPEFYMAFARKMTEFYMIIARQIFFPEKYFSRFWVGARVLPPPSAMPMTATLDVQIRGYTVV